MRCRIGVHERQGDLSLFAKFQYKKSKKSVRITRICGVWWYLNTVFIANTSPKLKLVGRAKQDGPNRRRMKTSLGKHCQNKGSKPATSLASMRLVLGADLVVCHICIRCIFWVNHLKYIKQPYMSLS